MIRVVFTYSKVNNGNTASVGEICSLLTIKTAERRISNRNELSSSPKQYFQSFLSETLVTEVRKTCLHLYQKLISPQVTSCQFCEIFQSRIYYRISPNDWLRALV